MCLHSIGENPNYGFTSFDNLLWSMLTTFQLITLDYWEDVYNMVIIQVATRNEGKMKKSGISSLEEIYFGALENMCSVCSNIFHLENSFNI